MVMGEIERLDPPQRLGNVTLLGILGEGGMATVYLASVGQESLARLAAVKLLRAGLPDHDYRTRFIDEAKVVLKLHHNNIVDVREAGEIDGQLFIVMALVEGRDLADIWDRCAAVGKAFPVPLAVHIIREILRGLHYAHTFPGLGLVHRDVSPSNILIDWAGAVRLADFGLATSTLKGSATQPGVVFGKVAYMSPEQARHEVLDGRTDVYACAAILWELLTGRPLRGAENIDTDQVSTFEAPPPSAFSSRVDPILDEIVVKGLERDREERFLSAHDFMEALGEWLADNSPGTGQEDVSEFMRMLFGDTAERERAYRDELLHELSRTQVHPHETEPEPEPVVEEQDIDLAILDEDEAPPPPQPLPVKVKAPAPAPERAPRRDPEPQGGPPDIEHIEPGTIIAERYRVINRIGRGGMGTVYLGEHTTVGRKVAIKVLTHQWSRNELVAKRFRAEARAASAAGHPNIIEVFDAGELPDGRLYLVMEYLTGRNLYDEIQELGTLPVGRACRIIRAVARAIRAAHEVGIIHRDLKPDNVMFVPLPEGEGETVKVLDFGISAGAERSESQARLTIPGHALGTPEYMAPEQAKGKEATELFDIYAVGVMLFETLVGEPPFVSNNLVEIMARKSTERAPSLGEKRPDLPRNLIQLVDDTLEIDPGKRPQTARDFIVRLEDVIRILPTEEGEGPEVSNAGMLADQVLAAEVLAASTKAASSPSPMADLRPSEVPPPSGFIGALSEPRYRVVWFGGGAVALLVLLWLSLTSTPDGPDDLGKGRPTTSVGEASGGAEAVDPTAKGVDDSGGKVSNP
ncbi:MAG TPA: serine/threonine-protein kinase, partial [Nannocystaceae bacterium]|nr:serine/threonine-protein kinase [Nannocystaceae bacterium]